jgi:hypothetical protein
MIYPSEKQNKTKNKNSIREKLCFPDSNLQHLLLGVSWQQMEADGVRKRKSLGLYPDSVYCL